MKPPPREQWLLLLNEPYPESPARQDKGNHSSSPLVPPADAHAAAPRSRETAHQHLSRLTTSLTLTGQAGKEGRGARCGRVTAQAQTRQSPMWPLAPSSPAPKTSSGRQRSSVWQSDSSGPDTAEPHVAPSPILPSTEDVIRKAEELGVAE